MPERSWFKSGRGFGFKASVKAAFETASLVSVGKAFSRRSVYLRRYFTVSGLGHSDVCVIKRTLKAFDRGAHFRALRHILCPAARGLPCPFTCLR